MNILFLSSRIPYPPIRGDKLRLYHIIRKLSSSGHRLFLISFIEEREEISYIKRLRGYCEEVIVEYLPRYRSEIKALKGIFTKLPLQVAYYQSGRMKKIIDNFLSGKTVDLIYVHLFRMAPYALNYKDVYKILDLTDVVSKEIELSISHRSGIKKLIYNLEFPRIRRYEIIISSEFDETWVISEYEAKLLRSYSPNSRVEVVTNGVDTDYFRPVNIKKNLFSLIFVGNLQVDHNVDAILYFYKDIFPLIRRKIPQTKFYITGASPDHRVKILSRDKNVVVTGLVKDLNLNLNKANIFIAPLRFSAGVQNKILEAMSAGLPVVCSPLANQGIEAVPEREILIANNSLHFAEQLIYLMENPERCKEIGLSARKFVKKYFKWENVIKKFQTIEDKYKNNF